MQKGCGEQEVILGVNNLQRFSVMGWGCLWWVSSLHVKPGATTW